MKAKEYAKYKFVYGKRAIIVPERVRANEEYEWQGFPPELEKRWLAAIRTSDSEEGPRYLDELFATIGRCNYDQIIHSLLSLVAAATHALPVIANSSGAIDLRSVYRLIFEKETLADVYELFVSLFHLRQQEEHRHMSENTKRQLLVSTIKEIVDAKYTDADLCLQSIADMVNLSSSYVGKQFRDQEDLSVAKYITAVRMKRAAKLLQETDDSVNAVMEKVGFLNQSYFFKLFKQHFNVTPNEFKSAHYRLNG
jgi:YesN/AraC family two-component response regulator